MRKLLTAAGYGTAMMGFAQMLIAAGYSDSGTATAKAIFIRLIAGLAVFCLGALLVNAASTCGRAER